MGLSDDDIKKMAKERLDFRMHLAAYLIINAMLVAIWFITTGPGGGLGSFWPVWTMVFWGVGLAFHAANVFGGGLAREEAKLRQKYQ